MTNEKKPITLNVNIQRHDILKDQNGSLYVVKKAPLDRKLVLYSDVLGHSTQKMDEKFNRDFIKIEKPYHKSIITTIYPKDQLVD